MLQVNELLRTDLPTVIPDETLDMVMDKFSRHEAHSLAVLNSQDDNTVKGLISRAKLMRLYQDELDKD